MSDEDLFKEEEEEPIEESPPAELPTEVPEADAFEQTRPLAEGSSDLPDSVGDRPEADALEQERLEDEEDEERR